VFAKFQQRLGRQPALDRPDLLSVRLIQAISFQTVTHSSAQRPTPIPFSFNQFRTLLTATEGVPSLQSDFAQFWCNLSLFRINTCGPLRTCCKQKTYTLAKPFKCNTYKKPRVHPSSQISFPSLLCRRSDVQAFRRSDSRPSNSPFGTPHLPIEVHAPLGTGDPEAVGTIHRTIPTPSGLPALCSSTEHGTRITRRSSTRT
jgi:hypothetical protein